MWNNKKYFKSQIQFPSDSEFTFLSMFIFPAPLCEPYNNLNHLTQTSTSFPFSKSLNVDCVTPNPLDYLYTIPLPVDFSC